jgi:hypothetical protein
MIHPRKVSQREIPKPRDYNYNIYTGGREGGSRGTRIYISAWRTHTPVCKTERKEGGRATGTGPFVGKSRHATTTDERRV